MVVLNSQVVFPPQTPSRKPLKTIQPATQCQRLATATVRMIIIWVCWFVAWHRRFGGACRLWWDYVEAQTELGWRGKLVD